jgi:tetratricopeptide (TPR) repeat protein
MPSSYKKWTMIILFMIVGGFIIFALTRSYYKTEKPAGERPERAPVTGPLVEEPKTKSEIRTEQVVPLEQLRVDTGNPESLALLGDKYFENNRFEQAIIIYERVLELNPKDVDTYNDLGLALHYTGRSDVAIETLKKGIKVMPSYQRIWLSLGFVLTSTKKNEEAKTALKKAIELDPNTEMGQEAKRILALLK